MFLKNGGYEQNPTMGGNIIKVARGKTYLGQNESWQDEMERTMLYLGMEEDENEQPPVVDCLALLEELQLLSEREQLASSSFDHSSFQEKSGAITSICISYRNNGYVNPLK